MGDSIYFELADDEIFEQLEDTAVSDFFAWNGTSLGNLFVAASGYNGKKVRVQAHALLLCFAAWYKDRYKMRLCLRPPWIFPGRTEEIQILKKTLEFLRENSVDRRDMNALEKYAEKFGLLEKFRELA